MKMKTFGLALALALAMSGAATADVATFDVYSGYNFVGPTLVPFDPAPTSVFSAIDVAWTDTLTRLDAPSQGWVPYWDWDPATFGNILLGDGYMLYSVTGDETITYDGVPDGVPDGLGNMTDMWISLPGYQLDAGDEGGTHLIWTPFAHGIPFNEVFYGFDGANIKVTDGTQTLTLLEAASVPYEWLQEPFIYFDNASTSWLQAGYLTGVYATDEMEPGVAYLVTTNKDNLALIIPADRPY